MRRSYEIASTQLERPKRRVADRESSLDALKVNHH